MVPGDMLLNKLCFLVPRDTTTWLCNLYGFLFLFFLSRLNILIDGYTSLGRNIISSVSISPSP